MTPERIERELERQIDPWLQHMRWRADFAEWRKKRLWQENYQTEALADLRLYGYGAKVESRILDLGAGMGGFAVALARESHSVIAIDYNPAYCEIARTRARRYSIDLCALVAAGEALPLASESFDGLTCWDVLEHVQDPELVFGEIARVLKPRGRAFVTAINRFALVDPHYHLRFVNWLPRALGEKYIVWRKRTKQSELRDRQKLSEMHYLTYRGTQRLAARYGFSVLDLNARRSRFKSLPKPLSGLLYYLWRTFGMATFRLVLTKESA